MKKNNNLITMKDFCEGMRSALESLLIDQMKLNCFTVVATGVVCLGINAYRIATGQSSIEEIAEEVTDTVTGGEA